MNPSIDRFINWFEARRGRTFYSMVQRNGQTVSGKQGFDCSSSVYYALIEAGFLPVGHRIGNTDSLFGDLERAGWVRTSSPQRGSIFIWGVRGQSGGAAGHTGAFQNAADVIHCAAFSNGITTNNYSQLRGWNGNPVQTIYTYVGSAQPSEGNDDQVLDIGSMIRFDKTYTADEVMNVGGIWQVRSHELCRAGFTWDDNGIPAEPLVEVDGEGYATADQSLDPGSRFVLPGKYEVLDLGQYQQYWMALISWNGLKFWIDVESVTEVKRSDPGRPTPTTWIAPADPAPQPEPSKPTEPTKPEDSSTTPAPEPQPEPTPQPEPETPSPEPTSNPKEEPKMAFQEKDVQQLQVATQSVLDANDFSPVISDRVKTVAYFATDITAILSGLVLTVLAVLGFADGTIAIMINSAIVAAMLGMKQTFRLSAKKK